MQTLILFIRLAFILLCVFSLQACSSISSNYPVNEFEAQEAQNALNNFRDDERLSSFFDQAEIIIIYPTNYRVAFGVGGAYGRGLVYRLGDIIGRSRVYQLNAGAVAGGEKYRQILFFKSEAAFDKLTDGFLGFPEFAGQAKASFVTTGASSTPSFNKEVALFTQLKGGLLLEASVGAHYYSFKMLEPDVKQKIE